MIEKFQTFLVAHLELLFWIGALCVLYFLPVSGEHFSLCPLRALGFSWCPGCGLGHSIHYLLHGEWSRSWHAHYLGFGAFPLIIYRIYQLSILKRTLNPYYHERKIL